MDFASLLRRGVIDFASLLKRCLMSFTSAWFILFSQTIVDLGKQDLFRQKCTKLQLFLTCI